MSPADPALQQVQETIGGFSRQALRVSFHRRIAMNDRRERGRGRWVYSRFVTRGGKRVYHPTGGLYRFWVKDK